KAGQEVFNTIGCVKCHISSYTTRSRIAALNGVTIFPYSDFLLHDMGEQLGDGITQGSASGRDFRTAPLWGVRYRPVLLHDGRARTLSDAILLHGGEAASVVI